MDSGAGVRIVRVLARILFEVCAFLIFVYFIYLAGMESWAGKWFLPSEQFAFLFLWGPLGAAGIMYFSWRAARRAERLSTDIPYYAMGASFAFVVGPAAEAATLDHGLWREWTALDSHFSNQLIRGYYFRYYVGVIGAFAAAGAYLSARLWIAAPRRFPSGAVALAAAPLLTLTAILVRQIWVPAPYFNG